jgi:hypothetical protein
MGCNSAVCSLLPVELMHDGDLPVHSVGHASEALSRLAGVPLKPSQALRLMD